MNISMLIISFLCISVCCCYSENIESDSLLKRADESSCYYQNINLDSLLKNVVFNENGVGFLTGIIVKFHDLTKVACYTLAKEKLNTTTSLWFIYNKFIYRVPIPEKLLPHWTIKWQENELLEIDITVENINENKYFVYISRLRKL